MHLTTLDVVGVRNLARVQIQPGSGINYFYGDNGAGKTSLLEAISLLSVGRSFRAGKTSTIISGQSTELIVSGQVHDINLGSSQRVGISKTRGSTIAPQSIVLIWNKVASGWK